MEPHIQYAKTEDGVDIAYSVFGEGEPLVYASNVWGDVHWYVHDDASRATTDGLAAAGWQVICYDGRGMGSSDHRVTDFSLEARVLDLEAVIKKLDLERFVLCGYSQGGPPSIAYCIRHPKRVSHLVLVNSFASGAAYYRRVRPVRALVGLGTMAEAEWKFFTKALASAVADFADPSRTEQMAELFRTSTSPGLLVAYVEAAEQIDVTDLLPSLALPTLVVQDNSGFAIEDLTRRLASQIPDASFVKTADYAEELHSFVRGSRLGRPSTAEDAQLPQGTAVILFVDIADSTGLTERLGDTAFRDRARKLDEVLAPAIQDASGFMVEGKLLGDGVLATFSSARDAIAAAQRCRTASEEAGLELHLGIHAGDVIREGNNIFGGAVNIASRVADASAPGEILVSATVRGLARTSAGVAFEDRGEHDLKGIPEPQRLFAVREQD